MFVADELVGNNALLKGVPTPHAGYKHVTPKGCCQVICRRNEPTYALASSRALSFSPISRICNACRASWLPLNIVHWYMLIGPSTGCG